MAAWMGKGKGPGEASEKQREAMKSFFDEMKGKKGGGGGFGKGGGMAAWMGKGKGPGGMFGRDERDTPRGRDRDDRGRDDRRPTRDERDRRPPDRSERDRDLGARF